MNKKHQYSPSTQKHFHSVSHLPRPLEEGEGLVIVSTSDGEENKVITMMDEADTVYILLMDDWVIFLITSNGGANSMTKINVKRTARFKHVGRVH